MIFALLSPLLAQLPAPPCPPGLPGCGGGPSNLLVGIALPEAARILLNTAAGLSLLFVIVGGARYVLSFGRDDELTKAKMTIVWALIGLVVALLSARIVKMVIDEGSIIAGSTDPIFAVLQRAASLNPDSPSPFYLLGRAFEKLQRKEEAARAFEQFAVLKKKQAATGGMAYQPH